MTAGPAWLGLPPEQADAARDDIALIRCALAGDEDGTAVILAAVEDIEAARDRLWWLAEVAAQLMRDRWPDAGRYLAGFQRKYGG